MVKCMPNPGNLQAARGMHLLLLLPLCLWPTLPLWFNLQLPATHEGYRYLLLSSWFSEAMAAGIWYPRWLPDMNGGFGYPEFLFYQPAYFFLNALVSTGVESLLLRQFITVSLIALLGGIGVYRLARHRVGPWQALLLVACFQLAPYVHTNLYLRGDLSEWMALELSPWPLHFLLQYCRHADTPDIRPRLTAWLGLAVSTALLCYCHPVALMFLPPILLFLGSFCLLRVKGQDSSRRLTAAGEMLAAIGLGLALSSPYWLTVMTMKPLVNVAAALDGFEAWKNAIPLPQLLFGSLLEDKLFQEVLGAPFVMLTLAGCWFGRDKPLILGAGLIYLALILAMTPAGSFLWHLYPFSLLQFPWRLAAFAPVLQTLCMTGLYRRASRLFLVTGFGLLLGWSLISHTGFKLSEHTGAGLRINLDGSLKIDQEFITCLQHFALAGSPGSYATTIDAGEWTPRSAANIAKTPGRGMLRPECEATHQAMSAFTTAVGRPDIFRLAPEPRPLLEATPASWSVEAGPAHTAFLLDYRLSGALPGRITINQLYLPGWEILIDGRPVPRAEVEAELSPDGRMQLQLKLPAGEWHLQARYAGPPGWQVRNMVILALCIVAAMYWFHQGCLSRRRHTSKDHAGCLQTTEPSREIRRGTP